MLRDLARLLSDGSGSVPAHNVVVVDERSEIAGCFQGIPQLNVGMRTDVLDACPKAVGMMMAIRSLLSQIIVTDEVGRREDVEAINDLHAGIAVITSIHARSVEELRARPLIKNLLDQGAFRRGLYCPVSHGRDGLNKLSGGISDGMAEDFGYLSDNRGLGVWGLNGARRFSRRAAQLKDLRMALGFLEKEIIYVCIPLVQGFRTYRPLWLNRR